MRDQHKRCSLTSRHSSLPGFQGSWEAAERCRPITGAQVFAPRSPAQIISDASIKVLAKPLDDRPQVVSVVLKDFSHVVDMRRPCFL